jgi:hypothetical protein
MEAVTRQFQTNKTTLNQKFKSVMGITKYNGIIVFTGVKTGAGYKTWCLTTDDGGAT